MINIKASLAYDGTGYFGWQKAKAGPSIEEELQKAIEKVLQYPVILQAASRTDRGVHAAGQVFNFFLKEPKDLQKFQFQLNCILPKDIRILQLDEVPLQFHPTLDVIEKTYVYNVTASPFQMPHERHFSWHVYSPLNLTLMQEAAVLLQGTHDFKGFSNRKLDELYSDTHRTIKEIVIEQKGTQFQFIITGNHFLYKMARNIVGTLIFIGCKKLPIYVINEVLEHKNRACAGVTPPAHGLTLFHIRYYDNTYSNQRIFSHCPRPL